MNLIHRGMCKIGWHDWLVFTREYRPISGNSTITEHRICQRCNKHQLLNVAKQWENVT